MSTKPAILIVEDDVPLRKQLRYLLENRGYVVFEASNKKEALEELREHAIDIAVVDLGLPPLEDDPQEGLELIEIIQEQFFSKIVVLTGQKTEEAAKESLKKGVFDYLMKPVDPEMFLQSIDRALFFKDIERKLEDEGIERIFVSAKIEDGVRGVRDEATRKLILKVLKDTNFNVYRASKILGMKRENLYYFLKKFGIKREDEE